MLTFLLKNYIKHYKKKKEILFNMRFQKSLQQLDHPMAIRNAKKDIARIKTRISAMNNKREI